MLKAPGLKFTDSKASEQETVRCTPFQFALLQAIACKTTYNI